MARPSSGRRISIYLVAFLLVGTAVWVPLGGQNQSEIEPSQTGIESSLQPSSGQGPDSACQPCHSDLYQAFQETGKAGSFFRPKPDRTIEDFSKLPYTHVPSNQYYELVWKESALWFRRYLRDPSGEAVLAFEVEVDWILGSGTQVRNYLYQTPLGELFQLPLAWYAEPDGWAIAAGYDNPYHPGVLKSVGRDCLFCHNTYPDYDVGSDRHGAPTASLPHSLRALAVNAVTARLPLMWKLPGMETCQSRARCSSSVSYLLHDVARSAINAITSLPA